MDQGTWANPNRNVRIVSDLYRWNGQRWVFVQRSPEFSAPVYNSNFNLGGTRGTAGRVGYDAYGRAGSSLNFIVTPGYAYAVQHIASDGYGTWIGGWTTSCRA